ncbi:ras family-domain-containing protein [Mycena galopus ATCC 62051]|nr:ras family-domain-containing protein [Mycena galopus ATCC 62051]
MVGALVPYTGPLAPGEAVESWRNTERWAMIRNPVPGRTLNEVYSVIGQTLETHANRAAHRLGLGPNVVAGKITSFFGAGAERQLCLSALWDEIPEKLERHCFRLMEYTLTTESSKTQCQAFERIVTLTTLFPGLRFIFLRSNCMQDVPVLVDKISALWNRSDNPTDPYWSFWRTFTATCLSETSIAVMLEETPVSQLTTCPKDSGSLSLIERLLVAHSCETDTASAISNALCIRYLAGILELPGFWMNMGSVHTDVARKLCAEMVRVLKDISIDILPSEEFLRSEAPFDYDGVDMLADAILVGISSWLRQINPTEWPLQPWHLHLREVVHLLRGPISGTLLPKSFSRASSDSFEKDIPTIYREVELGVMVETSTKTIAPPIPGFGLYYSENVSGSEKTAAPPIPREKKNSFSDAKITREFKITVLGSCGGGKTQLIERFINDTYADEGDPTIEEVYHRQIFLDDEISLLEIIDTAGPEEYEAMRESWIRAAEGFIIAFSLTREHGLKEIETLRDKIYRIKDTQLVPIVAVGLKSDLSYERQVDAATIESLSTQWNIPFYEASAKLNWHVNDVFEDLVRQLRLTVQYAPDPDLDLSDPVMKRRKPQQGPCIIM